MADDAGFPHEAGGGIAVKEIVRAGGELPRSVVDIVALGVAEVVAEVAAGDVGSSGGATDDGTLVDAGDAGGNPTVGVGDAVLVGVATADAA